MTIARNQAIKTFFAIVGQIDTSQDFRRNLILGFTKGRTDSIKQLSNREIAMLNTFVSNHTSKASPRKAKQKVIIALWYKISELKPELHWVINRKINQDKFKAFMITHTTKPSLNSMDYNTLLKLIKTLQTIKHNYELTTTTS